MTPIEQLRCTVPELQGMVGRMWHGQFELCAPGSDRTVHDILDQVIVSAVRDAALLRGEPEPQVDAPFVYGWVPKVELDEATTDLLTAAEVAHVAGDDLTAVAARTAALAHDLALALVLGTVAVSRPVLTHSTSQAQ